MAYVYQATPDSLKLHFLFYDVSRLLELQRSATSLTYEVKDNNSRAVLLRDTIAIVAIPNPESNDAVSVRVTIPRTQVAAGNVLNLKLWQEFAGQSRKNTSFRVPLQPAMLGKSALLVRQHTGQPLIQSYTTTTDTLLLQDADTTGRMVLYRFEPEFVPALPPMSTRQEPQPQTFQPLDSLTVAATDTFVFPQQGLYLLWPNTAFARGLLVEPWHFPQVTMAREMLQPLIYLTTSTERERLFKAPDPKKAIDDFWLSVAGEKHLARELIRTYYGRVEQANKLYTSYKPGWATDRGMIYLIYGPPSDISRVGSTETWIYRQTEMQPYVKFVFTKKENNFTENHYELVRRREYEESWYSAVAKWRAGITDM
ncbi:GWxTD domain-containing protein [Pontibacter sp. Tf4]|nr:GWxTD domain-containing protein [Pontibacter sp. Tf4]